MNQPQPSDEELIAAYRDGGSPRALEELLGRHLRQVRAAIYAMVLNDTDADDLAQEVFVRSIRGLAGFRGKARFSTWLYTTMTNTVRSFLRRRPRTHGASDDVLEAQVDHRHDGPDAAAMVRELDEEITAALGSLPPDLRAAIALTTIQGLEVREAARIEGCQTATMYWRLHKARRLLRQRLGKHLT